MQAMLGVAGVLSIPALSAFAIPVNRLQWFSVEGQIMFPMYGASGSLTSKMIAVLIDKPCFDGWDLGRHGLQERGGGRWYVIEFNADDSLEQAEEKIHEAKRVLLG